MADSTDGREKGITFSRRYNPEESRRELGSDIKFVHGVHKNITRWVFAYNAGGLWFDDLTGQPVTDVDAVIEVETLKQLMEMHLDDGKP